MVEDIPGIRRMLAELVAIPSISSASPDWDRSNEGVIQRLAHWLGELGFALEVMPVPGAPGKFNLIATLGQGPGGLVLSGHTDTVPYDQAGWQSDPFTLTERDNRWYGLGTCDMKGFFPLVIEAARHYHEHTFHHPLIVVATADEESSMLGAKALVEAGRPRARCAIIGEPTGLRPIRMHKGIMMERLVLEGLSGHSSDPALGRNALEGMQAAMGELLDLRQHWQQNWQHPGFRVAVPTLNLGYIHGGDNPNRICPACELHFDVRPLPGMSLDNLRSELRGRVARVAERFGLNMILEPLFDGIPPFETQETADLVQVCERLTGHVAESVAFATEAPFFQSLGLETLVMGPGSIDQAHQPDEYLALDQIDPTLRLLRSLIEHYCLTP